MREPLEFTAEELADEARFFRWYGDWAPFDLDAQVRGPSSTGSRAAVVAGRWLGDRGVHAVHRFGRRRGHRRLDARVRRPRASASTSATDWHLWTNDEWPPCGRCDDRLPDLPQRPDCQIWVRRDALSPWVMDMPLTPDVDGLWQNKRLPDHVLPLDEATWVAEDGIRYLQPRRSVLLFKARLRPSHDGPPRPPSVRALAVAGRRGAGVAPRCGPAPLPGPSVARPTSEPTDFPARPSRHERCSCARRQPRARGFRVGRRSPGRTRRCARKPRPPRGAGAPRTRCRASTTSRTRAG